MTNRSYKYRFYPSAEQENLLRQTIGCTRLVYNKALDIRTRSWYDQGKRISYAETSLYLTNWKKDKELQFLREVSSVPLQQSLRHLQTAFSNFWAGRTKYPKFKKKRDGGSAEFTKGSFKFTDGNVFIAKCKTPLNIKWSRPIPEGQNPTTITIKLDQSGRWTVSLLLDVEVKKLRPVTSYVGIDLGINSLATLSTGEKIKNPKIFKSKHKRLKKAQKSLSRKVKGSNNRGKAKLRVAKIQAEIADARKDMLHKLTTRLVRENQLIAIEDLAVKNMVKNHKLAQAISDASWGELVRQLEYKCEWYGRTLVKIDRWFPSSKRCSSCGHTVNKLPLNIREWVCPSCGAFHDRDINAAINVLAEGTSVLVCGASVRPERA